MPVVEGLIKRGVNVPISVDTVWSAVAQSALDAGASWINDISAGRIDSQMPGVAARAGCTVVLMHSRELPRTMQDGPRYGDVVGEAGRELMASVSLFKRAGVDDGKIIIDPGCGFAKTAEHNITLLRGIGGIVKLGYPVLAGLSRKSFIGAITGRPVEERLSGTLAATAVAYLGGARIFRVHDVRETVDFFYVFFFL
jgi:dihydropteroate synthase